MVVGGHVGLVVAALLLLGSAWPTVGRSFAWVEWGEELCFEESLGASEELRGSYQVVDGGSLDVDFAVIHAESQETLVRHDVQEEGKFSVKAPSQGSYRICFGNKQTSRGRKKVHFAVHAGALDELLEAEAGTDIADKAGMDELHQMVLRLGRRVSDLHEQEQYLRRRSERHQHTTEDTSARVLLSSVCEAVVLVGVNLWQIHYLRQFFEVKRII